MNFRKSGLVAAALVGAVGSAAMAGSYTVISTSGEPSLYSIVTSNYGTPSVSQANFNSGLSGGNAFTTTGGYSFTRLFDYGTANDATPTNLHTAYSGSTSDQRFSDGIATVNFLVKYAGYNNRFGWSNASGAGSVNNGNYNDLLGSVVGSSTSATLSSNFQLALKVDGGGTYRGSQSGAGGNQDNFVTWQVTHAGSGRTFWFVAIEDLDLGDRDYNDWVGEITMVPLPAAAWAGLSTLGGVGLVGFVRRRRLRA